MLAGCAAPPVEVVASPLPVESSPPPTPTPTPSPTPSPTPTGEATPSGEFPLTGVATDRPRTGEPVLAVKVDNATAAAPQVGLEHADIVYEQVVEGGVTRFLALFHSDLPDEVGPVRSARLLDADLLSPFRPVLAYSGARDEVERELVGTGEIVLVPAVGSGPFRRDGERAAPHDLLAVPAEVLAQGAQTSPVEPASSGLDWGPLPAEGSVGTELSIRMTPSQVTSWEYDDEAGRYRRFSAGVPFEVVGTMPVGAANVVVVLTDVGEGGCCDGNGATYVRTRIEGRGDAVLLRDGRRIEVTWVKPSRDSHLRLVDEAGSDVPLAPGPTWIHLAPTDAVG